MTKSPEVKRVILVGTYLSGKSSLFSSHRDLEFSPWKLVFKIKKLSISSRINEAWFPLDLYSIFLQNLCLAMTLAISPYMLCEDTPSTRDKQLLPKNIISASIPIVITQQTGIILSQKLARKQGEWHHWLSACKSSAWGQVQVPCCVQALFQVCNAENLWRKRKWVGNGILSHLNALCISYDQVRLRQMLKTCSEIWWVSSRTLIKTNCCYIAP